MIGHLGLRTVSELRFMSGDVNLTLCPRTMKELPQPFITTATVDDETRTFFKTVGTQP